jgi:glutathione peroxidase-family protein
MKRSWILASVALLAVVALVAAFAFDAPEAGSNASSADAPSTKAPSTNAASAKAPSAEDAAPPEVGETAPDFTLKDTDGQTYTLSDLRGQHVVLEWLNFGCPYVGKYYDGGKMQELQKTYTDRGVTWLSVVSSAPGKQGYHPPEKMNALNEKKGGNQTAILMDPKGKVGKRYGAKTTPHMYVIDPEGTLVYKGGIDDRPTTDPADLEGATNYVVNALEASMNGNEVETKTARPYGCSVKYASK